MTATFPITFPGDFRPDPNPDAGLAYAGAEENPDYRESGAKRIALYLRDKPRYMAMVRAFLEPANDIEQTLFALGSAFWLGKASGVAQTYVGRLVGQEREGRDDFDMARAIGARILMNRASGTVEELYQIIEAASRYGTGGNVRVISHPPKSFTVSMPGGVSTHEEAERLAATIASVSDAGENSALVYSDAGAGFVLTLDGTGDQVLDAGLSAGITRAQKDA